MKLHLFTIFTACVIFGGCAVGTQTASSSGFRNGIYGQPVVTARVAYHSEANSEVLQQLQNKTVSASDRNTGYTETVYLDASGFAEINLAPDRTYIILESDDSYARRLQMFDDPRYSVSVNLNMNWGAWADPWYNPWWGPWSHWYGPRYRYHYGWYGWNRWHYDPWYYNPWYYGSYGHFGWGGPWYYDPWYSPYYRYPYYSYYPHRPGHVRDTRDRYYGNRTSVGGAANYASLNQNNTARSGSSYRRQETPATQNTVRNAQVTPAQNVQNQQNNSSTYRRTATTPATTTNTTNTANTANTTTTTRP
ncbi:MAG: hypothetical protein FWE99_04670, partial [Bacteroidales bacterium]|nr:hypothetical protein [Bacteroidales bacterium]